jgi:hypothetical protein
MIIKDKIIIDTARHKDSNGYMHVDKSNITKEQVAPYLGETIPEWQELGLEPKKEATQMRRFFLLLVY